MRALLIGIALVVACLPSEGAWSNLHSSPQQNFTGCTSTSGTACTAAVTATTAGSAGVFCAILTGALHTMSAVTSAGTAWTHATSASDAGGAGFSIDCYYTLLLATGTTSIVGTIVTSNTQRQYMFWEFGTTGIATYDGAAAIDDSSASATQPSPSLQLNANNDAIVLVANCSAVITAISGGYTLSAGSGSSSRSSALLLNTNSGASVNWTTSGTSFCSSAMVALGDTRRPRRVVGQ